MRRIDVLMKAGEKIEAAGAEHASAIISGIFMVRGIPRGEEIEKILGAKITVHEIDGDKIRFKLADWSNYRRELIAEGKKKIEDVLEGNTLTPREIAEAVNEDQGDVNNWIVGMWNFGKVMPVGDKFTAKTKEEKPKMLRKAEVLSAVESALNGASVFDTVVLQKSGKFVVEKIEEDGTSPDVLQLEILKQLGLEYSDVRFYYNNRMPVFSQNNEDLKPGDGEVIREVRFELEDWRAFGKNLENGASEEKEEVPEPEVIEEEQESVTGNSVDKNNAVKIFNDLMKEAGHKVKVWKDGVSYYNDHAQLMWMNKKEIFRLQLVGVHPTDYPDFEISKYRKIHVPHFDFCDADLDGEAILRKHLGI